MVFFFRGSTASLVFVTQECRQAVSQRRVSQLAGRNGFQHQKYEERVKNNNSNNTVASTTGKSIHEQERERERY